MTDDEKQAIAAKVKGKKTLPVDPPIVPPTKKVPVLMKTRPYGTVHGDPIIRFTQNGHDFDQHEAYVAPVRQV